MVMNMTISKDRFLDMLDHMKAGIDDMNSISGCLVFVIGDAKYKQDQMVTGIAIYADDKEEFSKDLSDALKSLDKDNR